MSDQLKRTRRSQLRIRRAWRKKRDRIRHLAKMAGVKEKK